MFNYIISDKSVTYKTEILSNYLLSGRAGRKNIWLRHVTYGPSASLLHDRETNIFPTGLTKFGQ